VSQRLLPRTDVQGRVLAVEILRNNSAVANLIREGKTHQIYSVIETHAKAGMVTLDTSIKDLYLRGLVSYEDAAAHVKNAQVLMGS
jgi:twitching motility protein PilT